ncbi:MAG: folylpolyglutamate synthase/dihydrofolate synthase family protein [Deltaproteobacteria bacterium]|nr:folylpolyglutamate synthase/dihydrofolate synthase family protein [Deltaproteobacteria bacterium]
MTDYQRTLAWLYALEAAKGMDFKLERVALALRRLGDPHRRYAVLHVAGTNGKGSVAALLDAVLRAAGRRVGLYTSPHLVDLAERIQVDGGPVPHEQIVALADEVRAATSGRGIDLTFFEILTVMAFLAFARAGVDAAVVEVGLGGRLDATNVVDPLVAVITSIGLDHTEWLGDTRAAIAAEKGGIIKAGRPLVLGRLDAEAAAVLGEMASRQGAPVIAPHDAAVGGERYAVGAAGSGFDFDGLGWTFRGLPQVLRGAHQLDNAGTAVAALAAAREVLGIDEVALRSGLARVHWPGRLEIVARAPLTVVDGAHNPDGAAALARELPRLLAGRPLHLLFAVMGDKDWRPMVEILAPLCRGVVVTEVRPPRGAPCRDVAAAFAPYCAVTAEPDLRRAWQLVRGNAGAAGAVVAAGSLFLVGALRELGLHATDAAATGSGTAHP